jgi:tetratricopeptide (TPR) repeat protein
MAQKIVLGVLISGIAAFAVFAGAQQQNQPQQAPARPVQSAPQSTTQSATPAQQPSSAAPAQATPGAASPGEPAHHAPQAKSQDEFTAYQQVIQQQDADAAASAADQFAVKYPQSELRAPLYQEITRRYFSANKADQVLVYGRKTLDIEPNNPLALSMIARVLAERTQENDIDHDERLNEAVKDADKVVSTIDQSLPDIIPPGVSPQQAEGVKRQLLFMAWDAEGKAQMELKQDAKAQQSFEKALQYGPEEARTRFRLALTLDRQSRYPDALKAVDQALQNAQDDAVLTQQAQQEKTRLQQLTGAGGAQATPQSGASPKPPAS